MQLAEVTRLQRGTMKDLDENNICPSVALDLCHVRQRANREHKEPPPQRASDAFANARLTGGTHVSDDFPPHRPFQLPHRQKLENPRLDVLQP